MLNPLADKIPSLLQTPLDVSGHVVFSEGVGVCGDLLMDLDAAIRFKNIDPAENGTSVQVCGDLYFELAKSNFCRQHHPAPSLGHTNACPGQWRSVRWFE
jgi:hypothetical protein